MANGKRTPLIKKSVVSSTLEVETVVWRRRDVIMSDQDVDDVAFLTGSKHLNHETVVIDVHVCSDVNALMVNNL